MLASIITNLQNVKPVRPAKLPLVKIDRGGGGPSWPYAAVDILAAIQAFPEVAGEDPGARAVRRARWIGWALPKIREARERREAGVFLTGTQLGYAAGYAAGVSDSAAQPSSASEDVAAQPSPASETHGTSQAVEPLDFVKAWPKRVEGAWRADRDRGEGHGAGLIVAALALGAIGAVALLRRRH
jgi:hypothetical protein